jgi:putative inorganic carbon (hco3(-)) transporter
LQDGRVVPKSDLSHSGAHDVFMKQKFQVQGVRSAVRVNVEYGIRHFEAFGLVAITFLSFFPHLFHYQEYAFLFFLALSVTFAWTKKANPFVHTPVDLPLFGFVGWVLFTVPFALDSAYSFSEWRKLLVQVATFYWAMSVFRHSWSASLVRSVLLALVLGSLALSLFALEDFLSRGGTWRDRVVRAGAPASDYNWLTTYLVLVIPILIVWCADQRKWKTRVLGVLALVLAAIAQLAAYTRAGWIAHFAQALGCVYILRRQQLVIWLLLGAVAMGASLVAVSQTGYQRDTMDPWTFSSRVKTWQLGLEQVLAHPLVGAGYGNNTFSKLYSADIEAEKGKGAEQKVLSGLHNAFAMVLVGSGVPAFIFFLWTLARIVRNLAAYHQQRVHQWTAILLLPPAISLAVVGFAVRNVFDYMFAGSLASLFWILVALGLSLKREEVVNVGAV